MLNKEISLIFIMLFGFIVSILIFFHNPKIGQIKSFENYNKNILNFTNKFDYRHWLIMANNENDQKDKSNSYYKALSLLRFNDEQKMKVLLNRVN